MATYNATGNATTVTPQRPAHAGGFVFIHYNKIDFSDSTLFTTNADDTDVVQVLPIKAGWGVMGTVVNVTTAFTGESTITCDVGITGDDPNGFDDDIDLTSTGYSYSAVGTDADVLGSLQFFAANDTIDLLLTVSGSSGGITGGIMVISAFVCDHSWTGMPAVEAV